MLKETIQQTLDKGLFKSGTILVDSILWVQKPSGNNGGKADCADKRGAGRGT